MRKLAGKYEAHLYDKKMGMVWSPCIVLRFYSVVGFADGPAILAKTLIWLDRPGEHAYTFTGDRVRGANAQGREELAAARARIRLMEAAHA